MDTIERILSDPALLARLQFAMTAAFHYIYPPMSIGVGVIILFLEAQYVRTRRPEYLAAAKFWVGLFAVTFAMGVVTGIVMEFQFGMNWSSFSRFAGDIFGAPLAAEAIFAFFMESIFLGVMIFGWNRITPAMHLLSSAMVALGAHISAVWIVVANSWMQTPAGFRLVERDGAVRAEIADFSAAIMNPSTMSRLSHVIFGAWLAGAALVVSVSAWQLLMASAQEVRARARITLTTSLMLLTAAAFLQLATGHHGAMCVARHQPAKLAAFEGHFAAEEPGDLYLFGWADEAAEKVRFGVALPGGLSFLIHGKFDAPLPGMKSFAPHDRPPVNIVFQSYHLMVALGMLLIGLGIVGVYVTWSGDPARYRWLLWAFTLAFLLPHAANQAGWMAAEIGRQPWIVYGVMKTAAGLSPSVPARSIIFSIVVYGTIYSILFFLYVMIVAKKIGTSLRPAKVER